MQVLAINGSPRRKKSSTNHILGPLLDGMRAAGAATDLVHLGELEIKPCLGCFMCWVKTPGICVQKDDMAGVLEKFVRADLLIFGTPLYKFNVSGLMKNFIDRTLPALEPWIVEDPHNPGRSSHPKRYPRDQAILLVSPCGFPEFDHFTPLVQFFQFYAQSAGWRYLGEILRPGGDTLSDEEYQEMFTGYYQLVRQAGEQLIRQGGIAPEVQAGLRQDLFPGGLEAFRESANQNWMKTMAKFGVIGKPPGQAG